MEEADVLMFVVIFQNISTRIPPAGDRGRGFTREHRAGQISLYVPFPVKVPGFPNGVLGWVLPGLSDVLYGVGLGAVGAEPCLKPAAE
jgi:hypothetical protein